MALFDNGGNDLLGDDPTSGAVSMDMLRRRMMQPAPMGGMPPQQFQPPPQQQSPMAPQGLPPQGFPQQQQGGLGGLFQPGAGGISPMTLAGLALAGGNGSATSGIGNMANMLAHQQQYQQQLQQQRQAQEAVYNMVLQSGGSRQEAMGAAMNPQAWNMMQQRQLEQQKLNQPKVVPYGAQLMTPQGQVIGASSGNEDAKAIAEGIQRGDQPPTLQGLYRMGAPVRAELAKEKFSLADAQLQYARAQKQIQALNGPQMVRYQGLAISVDKTIDEVRDLTEKMKLSGVPLRNKAELMAYMQTQGNSPNGQLATKYITALNTLKEEFANLAQGGYAPTEPVWDLANKQLNENYGMQQMNSSLNEIQRLVRYRLNAIPNINTLGAAVPNRYIPGSENNQQMPPTPTSPQQQQAPVRKIDRAKAKAAGYSDEEIDAFEKGQ